MLFIISVDTIVLLENTQLVKFEFIRNHIRVSSDDIDDFTDIKLVSANIFRRFMNIAEDSRRMLTRLWKKTRTCLDHAPTNFKLDISEIIDIFTS